MRLLVDAYVGLHRLELFELGVAINAAMAADPKKALGTILSPPKRLRMEDLPPMLRIPKKKRKSNAQ